jgi:hypothetical protein
MGAWIIAVSAAVALVTAFVLRTRVPAGLGVALLAVAGAGVGWGGMLLQPDPSTFEFVLTIALLALLFPAHVRIVLGRFGPSARGEGIRAMTDPTP